MGTRLEITSQSVKLRITGRFNQILTLCKGVELPLSEITAARVTTWDDARGDLGWRTAGTYVPGWIATGWYAVPGRKGARQLWSVWRDRSSLLVIETTRQRPARVVVAFADASALCDRINAALAAR